MTRDPSDWDTPLVGLESDAPIRDDVPEHELERHASGGDVQMRRGLSK